jgi:hypothetical protein
MAPGENFAVMGRQWHATCIVCTQCKEPLLGKPMSLVNQRLYCPSHAPPEAGPPPSPHR